MGSSGRPRVELSFPGWCRSISWAKRRPSLPPSADYKPTDPQIAWHLARFIENVRAIPSDPVIVRQNWLKAYDFVTDKGALALNDYARANDPFAQDPDKCRYGRCRQRHPRLGKFLPHRLDRAWVPERQSRRDRALDRDPHHRRFSRRTTRSACAKTRSASSSTPSTGPRSWENEVLSPSRNGARSSRLPRRLPVVRVSSRGKSVTMISTCRRRCRSDPPQPVKIIEIPKVLPMPGQLKSLARGKGEPASRPGPKTRSSRPTPPGASTAPRRLSERRPGLSLFAGRALSGLRRSR